MNENEPLLLNSSDQDEDQHHSTVGCSYGVGDDLPWYKRYNWEYFSRVNWKVLEDLKAEEEAEDDEFLTGQRMSVNIGEQTEDDPAAPASHPEQRMARTLTVWELLGYGIASTVGAGIYVVTGQVANQFAGPGIVLCFVLASLSALLSAFAYAEFAARIPVSGSAYTFAYVSLGEVVAWFIGSNLTLEYAISASAVARGFALNVAQMFFTWGVAVPDWLIGYSVNDLLNISPLAAILILSTTAVLCLGVQTSARFNIIMVIFNVTTILLVIYLGAWNIDDSNYTPFLPYHFTGVLKGTGVVFFSYVGFDSVSCLAGEVKNPSRDLPIGIVGTLGVATSLYIGVSLVLCGMMSYLYIDADSPLSYAFTYIGMDWAGSLIAVASVIALTATTLCSLLGQPRIFYQMALDGLLWPIFAKVNRNKVPLFGTIFSGIFSAIIALLIDLNDLTQMISIGTLMAFTVVSGGIVIIRCRPVHEETEEEERDRRVLGMPTFLISWLVILFCVLSILFAVSLLHKWPLAVQIITGVLTFFNYLVLQLQKHVNPPNSFACPLVPFLPCVGMLINIFIIVSLDIASVYRVIIWSVFCFIIYFGYGIHHSKLNGSVKPTGFRERRSSCADDHTSPYDLHHHKHPASAPDLSLPAPPPSPFQASPYPAPPSPAIVPPMLRGQQIREWSFTEISRKVKN